MGEAVAVVVEVATGVAVGFGDGVADGGVAGESDCPQAATTTTNRALESQRGATMAIG